MGKQSSLSEGQTTKMCPTVDGASAVLNKQLQVSHRQISRDLWRQLVALRGSHAGVSMLHLGFTHLSDSEIRFGAMNGQMQPRGGRHAASF